jgi:hypothetical protein
VWWYASDFAFYLDSDANPENSQVIANIDENPELAEQLARDQEGED